MAREGFRARTAEYLGLHHHRRAIGSESEQQSCDECSTSPATTMASGPRCKRHLLERGESTTATAAHTDWLDRTRRAQPPSYRYGAEARERVEPVLGPQQVLREDAGDCSVRRNTPQRTRCGDSLRYRRRPQGTNRRHERQYRTHEATTRTIPTATRSRRNAHGRTSTTSSCTYAKEDGGAQPSKAEDLRRP